MIGGNSEKVKLNKKGTKSKEKRKEERSEETYQRGI